MAEGTGNEAFFTRLEKVTAPRETASSRFIEILEECRWITSRVEGRLDDFLNVSAEECHWGNVGDAGQVLEALKGVAEVIARVNG